MLEHAQTEFCPQQSPDGRVKRGARHRSVVCFGETGIECGKIDFAEQSLREMDGVAVAPSVSDVCGKMLRRSDDAPRFDPLAEGDSHPGCEKRIFTIGFFHPSPSYIA